MKLFVNIEIGGVRKVYAFPNDDASQWTKREIVADFVNSDAGLIAYEAFKGGIARNGKADLFDYQTGKCLAGDLSQLDA